MLWQLFSGNKCIRLLHWWSVEAKIRATGCSQLPITAKSWLGAPYNYVNSNISCLQLLWPSRSGALTLVASAFVCWWSHGPLINLPIQPHLFPHQSSLDGIPFCDINCPLSTSLVKRLLSLMYWVICILWSSSLTGCLGCHVSSTITLSLPLWLCAPTVMTGTSDCMGEESTRPCTGSWIVLWCLYYWLRVVLVKLYFSSCIIMRWGATWGLRKCCRLCTSESGGLILEHM